MDRFRTPQLKLIHNVLELAKNINRHQEIVLKAFDISPEQLNILITLNHDTPKAALSLLEIQENMILPTTNTSRLVDKLKEKGLVTRRTDRDNRRKVKIQITAKGKVLMSEVIEQIKTNSKKISAIVSDEEAMYLGNEISKINELILDWD